MRDVTRKWCNFQLHTNKSNVYHAPVYVYLYVYNTYIRKRENGSRCETMYMPLCLVILDILPGKFAGWGGEGDGEGGSGIVDRSPGIPIIAIIRAHASMTPSLSVPPLSPFPSSTVFHGTTVPLNSYETNRVRIETTMRSAEHLRAIIGYRRVTRSRTEVCMRGLFRGILRYMRNPLREILVSRDTQLRKSPFNSSSSSLSFSSCTSCKSPFST